MTSRSGCAPARCRVRRRSSRAIVLAVLAVLAVSGASASAFAQEGSSAPPPPAEKRPEVATPSADAGKPDKSDYTIGSRDILAITVFNQTDLSGKFLVDDDGTFAFPLIGRVTAAGLSARSVEAEMKKRLADGFFQNPQLSVSVDEYRSQRVFVVGDVRAAGTYPLRGNMNIIEVLALAGAAAGAGLSEVVIVRPNNADRAVGPTLPSQAQNAQVIHVDVNELQGGVLSQNVQLKSGDTIFVPRAQTVFVYGQVRSPGAYPVGRTTTVMQLLALAGGVTDRGAANRVKVLRVVNGVERQIKLKFTDVVQPGDTVVVPERFF
jgi:polysaccharide export outer membrane protein